MRQMVYVKVVCEREVVTKLCVKDAQRKLNVLLLDQQRHHCARQSALQQSPHASVTCECHKHCQVPNVTKNLNMTIDMKRRTLHQPML